MCIWNNYSASARAHRRLRRGALGAFMIHHWLGWISLALCVVLLAKYIGRVSGSKGLNKRLRALHKPLGIAVTVTAALHGAICLVKCARTLSLITGAAALALILALALTYCLRTKLKKRWFPLHQQLSIATAILCALHVAVSLIR